MARKNVFFNRFLSVLMAVCFKVLAEDGALNEENISPAELDRIYQPLIEQVTESVGKQESIQANLQVGAQREHVCFRNYQLCPT